MTVGVRVWRMERQGSPLTVHVLLHSDLFPSYNLVRPDDGVTVFGGVRERVTVWSHDIVIRPRPRPRSRKTTGDSRTNDEDEDE